MSELEWVEHPGISSSYSEENCYPFLYLLGLVFKSFIIYRFFLEEPVVVGLMIGALIKQLKPGTPSDRCIELSGRSNLIALITCLHQAIIYLVAACLSSSLYYQFPGEQESLCFVPKCASGPSTMPAIRKELQKNLLSGRRSWWVRDERENLKSGVETRLPPLNDVGKVDSHDLAWHLYSQSRSGKAEWPGITKQRHLGFSWGVQAI